MSCFSAPPRSRAAEVLELREGLLLETLAQLRACGAGRDECVAYWTGPLDRRELVDGVLHPVHEARPDHYEIDQNWLHETWRSLSRERRQIRVQIHTHGRVAFHSATDDAYPVIHQPGFLSLVVPYHAARDDLEDAYLAELQADGGWVEVAIDHQFVIA